MDEMKQRPIPATNQEASASEAGRDASLQAPVAIIGFGVAGFNAAVGLRTSGYEGPINVFSNIDTLPYSPILTSYYAGGEKTYEECFPWSAEEVDDLDLNVLHNARVKRLDVKGKTIKTEQGEYPYSKCVIATGATPVANGFPLSCGYEPLMLRTMEDAQVLKDHLEDPTNKRILVSGASMVALKILEAALNHDKDVTLVGMNPNVLDFNAVPASAERFERGLAEKGVDLRLGRTIADLEKTPSGEHKLKVFFSDGTSDDFDCIAVAHGMKCNLGFLEPGELEMEKAILVDEFMRTSNPDVYAAGDVVQALELVSGKRKVVGIWKCAATQGQIAGTAIASELAGHEPDRAQAYKGAIPSNTIAVNGTLFISGGTILPSADEPELEIDVRETEDMTVVYAYEGEGPKRKLVGFNVVCDHDEEGGDAYDIGAMLTLRIEKSSVSA